jgi:hypothetical protein
MLAAVVIGGSVTGGEEGSSAPQDAVRTQAETPTPATTTPSPSPTTTTPTSSPTTTAPTASPTTTTPTSSPTQGVSLAEWREQHATDIVLVIGTANNLISAINSDSEVALTRACDALKNNYSRYLQPIPAPPGDMQTTWYDGKDGIYGAQSRCRGGILRSPDLYQAQMAARAGVASLDKVVGPVSLGRIGLRLHCCRTSRRSSARTERGI